MTVLMSVLAIAAPNVSENVNQSDNRWHIVRPYNAKLERMAWCESRQRWSINTGNGYYGGLQFDLPTWRSAGGRGLPHWASKLEQKYRAVLVIRRRGYRPWPVCGYA